MIHLDFESRSEVNIFDSGAWVYSIHPSTEILCLSYAIDDGDVVTITREELRSRVGNAKEDLLLNCIEDGELVMAHNAFFEQCIWHNKLIQLLGCQKIPLRQWRCSAAKARAHALPASLSNVGTALNLDQRKNYEGKKIMLKMCKPRAQWLKDPENEAKWFEDPEDFQKLYEYCEDDVRAERAVDRALLDLNAREQELWFLDQIMNGRGVYIDLLSVEAALDLVSQYTEKLTAEASTITDGYIDAVSKRARVLQWIETQGITLKDYTKNTVLTAVKDPKTPENVRRLLEIRLQLGKTSIAKYDAMKRAVGPDKRIRDTLIYHGASTGRWSGKLVQIHNLPQGKLKNQDTCIKLMADRDSEYFEMLYPDVMEALSSCIRGMITAPPGRDLIVADYNAIETRVLFWLANDQRALEKLRKGEDIYVDMAQSIYNRGSILNPSTERDLGKKAILGCGYGMGAPKFLATCLTAQLSISALLAERAVKNYREVYRSVTDLWAIQDKAAQAAVKTSQVVNCGKVKWKVHNNFLFCRLPSGRFLAYREPRIEPVKTPWGQMKDQLTYMAVNSQTKQWVRTSTYGGKIVENITQAVARDIMAEGMLNCEAAGYKLIFSVHDEVVAEIPEVFGNVTEYENLLTKTPDWAEGCPIKAEGWRGKRYKK